METSLNSEQRLFDKIQQLSPEKIAVLETFVDFLTQQNLLDSQLTQASAKLSEPVFHQIWDNPDDAEYDNL